MTRNTVPAGPATSSSTTASSSRVKITLAMYSMPTMPLRPKQVGRVPGGARRSRRGPPRRCQKNSPVTATSPNVADSGGQRLRGRQVGDHPGAAQEVEDQHDGGGHAGESGETEQRGGDHDGSFGSSGYNACYCATLWLGWPTWQPPRATRPAAPASERARPSAWSPRRCSCCATTIPSDLTVRRIATAAGTTTMALYTGYGSRDGLLDVVYARGFEQLR